MRAARQLVAEMELWKLVWQQVETFVDRVEGARDEDATGATRLGALLTAAMAVERERTLRVEDAPLGDPVIDAPPRPELGTGWRSDHRIWRLPGADELELAVGNLYEEPGSGEDPVEILPPSDFFSYYVEPGDRDYEKSDNGLITVRIPGYPGQGDSTIAGVALPAKGNPIFVRKLAPDIKEDGDKVSLFSPDRRGAATADIDQEEEHVQLWSELTAKRRGNRRGANEADVNYYGGSGAQVAWTSAMGLLAVDLGTSAIQNTPPASGRPGIVIAQEIAEAARGAAATTGGNGVLLRQAAETLEEVGTTDADIPGLLHEAADGFGASPELFTAVADAADALAGFLSVPLGFPAPDADFAGARSEAAQNLIDAANELSAAMSQGTAALFNDPVEDGPLTREIDDSVAARIAYPDGSLRILRALESAFVRFWPSRIRWFTWRGRLVLGIAFARFRAPFLAGLRALIKGGDTGFPVHGLSVLAGAPTRATKLRLDHPASFALALRDVEAGHVVLTSEGRAAAMIVLGASGDGGRLAFDISPLRVSIMPAENAGPDDTPGQITGGQTLETFVPAPGLGTAALRLGEHPTDPTADGPVETTVILYSQLALIFGWQTVEAGIGGPGTYAGRLLPDPSDAPAEALTLYGQSPANCTTLVILGASNAYWDRSDPADPLPRFARPGEYMLIRGRSAGEEGGPPGPFRQAAIEVESAYATTAKAFHRMDATTVALLSTAPLPSEDIDACLRDCAPEEHLIVIVLARSWQSMALVSDVTIRRDFAGFDLPSLAAGTLMPSSVIETVTGAAPPGPAEVDRAPEFKAATGILADWLRFARR